MILHAVVHMLECARMCIEYTVSVSIPEQMEIRSV